MIKTKPVKLGSRGYFSLAKYDAEGNPRTEGCPKNATDNVVTYEGASYSLVADNNVSRIFERLYGAIGTGVSEIVRTDTSLGNQSSGRTARSGAPSRAGNEVDNLDGTSTVTCTRTMPFSLGEKVGTFSEVGMYTSSSGGTFIAGQLIKDEFGDPTTVTVLADEQLVITYTIEWVVPNTSKLVGTGTVTDANSNNYNYEVWAQPYFCEYTGTSKSCRLNEYSSCDNFLFRAADGTTVLGSSIDTGDGYKNRYTHNGSGLVTSTTAPYTYSPAGTAFTDAVFIGGYVTSATSSITDIVDTATALTNSHPGSYSAFVVKFLNPVTKTSSQSFSMQVEMNYTV